MSKFILSILLLAHLLTLGCTGFWYGGNREEKNTNTNIIKSEIDRCSYGNGFTDSVSDKRPDDLCFIIKENAYRRGFLSGTGYISRRDQLESLKNMLINKRASLDSLMKSGMVQHFKPGTVDEILHEISEMKKEAAILTTEMNDLKNDSTTF